ncbi:MAG: hypothetical protein ACREJC_10250 [Tepidisphaeraceae bacterium]
MVAGAIFKFLTGPLLAGGAAVAVVGAVSRGHSARFAALARCLGGAGKRAVAARLGVPGACGRGDPFESDVWYYRLDRSRKLALVIRFCDGFVRTMAVIRAPAR